jgi:riboflavin kinase/FMN adenylyltransferase
MTDLMLPPTDGQRPVFHDPHEAGKSFEGRSVICIGTFDGVHRGHQAILAKGEAIARANGHHLIVVTFHPHPKSVVAPQIAPRLLSDPMEKATMLAYYGAKSVVQLAFNQELAETPASVFLNSILNQPLRPAAIVFGDDFRFGRGREGTPEYLKTWGDQNDCQIELLEQVTDKSMDLRISSSLIRRFLNNDQFDAAIGLLGHAYPVSGAIKAGAGRGKKIGYPTWNLHIPDYKLPPPVGIYAGWAGRTTPRPAMAYYGSTPTFGGHGNWLEANLIGEGDETTPQEEETIWLGKYVREEVKFDDADALTAQLAEDERIVSDILSTVDVNQRRMREK